MATGRVQALPEPNATAFDARVDAKIAAAATSLQPVLLYLRELVHKAVPDATETIKWGMPFFLYRGTILANLGIFKGHCSFGFWSRSMTQHLQQDGVTATEGAGSLGKVVLIEDLPPRKQLEKYMRLAAEQIRDGKAESPFAGRSKHPGPDGPASKKPEQAMPQDFATALQASALASQNFEKFPASCRREYLAWIAEAKREDTRARRIAQAVLQLQEGKRRNWQYETGNRAK